MFWIFFKLEIIRYIRRKAFIINNLFFYLIIITLFALTKDSSSHVIQNVGGIWIAFIIIVSLSNEMLFSNDKESGILTQLRMASLPFPLIIFIKILVYWIGIVLPLIIITPLIMIFLQIPSSYIFLIMGTLLLASPTLLWVIGLMCALTLNLRHNGLFLIILIVPLLIPLILMSLGIIRLYESHLPYISQMGFLMAALVFSTTCAPFVIAYVLSNAD